MIVLVATTWQKRKREVLYFQRKISVGFIHTNDLKTPGTLQIYFLSPLRGLLLSDDLLPLYVVKCQYVSHRSKNKLSPITRGRGFEFACYSLINLHVSGKGCIAPHSQGLFCCCCCFLCFPFPKANMNTKHVTGMYPINITPK